MSGVYWVTNKRTGTDYGAFPAASRDKARMLASKKSGAFLLELRALKVREVR